MLVRNCDYRVALAQINATVGDVEGNAEKVIGCVKKAKWAGADLVVFPELTTTGYPPKDLLLKPSFISANKEGLKKIVRATSGSGIAVVVGFVDGVADADLDADQGENYNAAALIRNGRVVGVQRKTHLPNYDVFDEKRYFKPATATETSVFELEGEEGGREGLREGLKLGINICEDIWAGNGPTTAQARLGADLVVNLSASPFYAGKSRARRELISRRARENRIPIACVNLVGGQDDLVFDGGSCVFNAAGSLIAECRQFEEDLVVANLEGGGKIKIPEKEDPVREIFGALVLGIRDYVRKNGFEKVVVGLSGGVDSALCAALAVEALGAENVVGVSMPSAVTSQASKEDAVRLAANLGIELKVVPIVPAVDAYTEMLSAEFSRERETETETETETESESESESEPESESDATEENIQARIRGNVLMALSNKFGYLVLSTGNKSELAVGYCTLYGDLAGGLAVLSDVSKTTVYKLAKYTKVIPEEILIKPPSAELRAGQKDTDSLPPYEVLDPILQAYIEENKSREEIIARGFDASVVSEVAWKVDRNEYKRQQAPVGIKITSKAFGSGRRMPITNRYND